METNPSLGWEKLSDVYYRNRQLTSWDWNHKNDVSHSFSTTLCALYYDQKIECYNYLGELIWGCGIASLPSKLVTFQFDEEETFIMVLQDRIRRYTNWFPLVWEETILPPEVIDTIWDYKNGVVILQSSQDIYYYSNNRFELVCENAEQFTIPTKHHWNASGDMVVICDVESVFHFKITSRKLEKVLSDSRWQVIKISPKGFVCLFNIRLNKLAIYKDSAYFLLEQVLEETADAIEWCGNDTIAYSCQKNEEVKLIGPKGSYVSFWYPDRIIDLRMEVDGVKVMTSTSVNFISKVEIYTSKIFSIGSTESSAILLDSLELLSNHAPRAIENLKVINLEQAVLECTLAAREEFTPYWQKRLLSAASFGKDSLSSRVFNSKIFVQTCNLLRVLNWLSQLGLPITARQYDIITINGIVARLVRLRKFHKCIQICNFLNHQDMLPYIFKEWAVAKIKLSTELDDIQLYKAIKKQSSKQSLSYLNQVARTAFLEGRFELAKKLALDSTLPKLKLQLLLDMDENELALIEAVKTFNTDLILSLLMILRKKLTTAQFTKVLLLVLKDNELMQFYERDNSAFLYDFYRQTDNFQDLAQLIFSEGERKNALPSFLPQVQNLYGNVLDSAIIKEDKELISRQIALAEFQQELSTKVHHDFTNLTMDNTVTKLIELGQEKYLTKLLKLFKISDKKYYQIKCQTLSNMGRFEQLNAFAKEKKSPIGYKPFFECVYKKGHKREAAVYVSMITGIPSQEKIEMYLKCGSLYDAIQLASREKDQEALKYIQDQIPPNQPQLQALLRDVLNKL
ncbi:tethering complex subunit VPS16 Ecym_2543 [Eremothecium cymbalariae DBVPG|uniref:Probable vacuolar protein sorting-associated protein 16 homolog n=1 Tax=Eremothecium cymbalariae (strain CBS 270.75 / DBVPG 7215 / KCTC 17166 / NRRL Y-17582) TaxID=931890 RepID=G8JQA5_ERECY|nr:Hypothetical protein Ecym_2543 [Eremothecium cymbalariae DBVPG\